MAEEAKETKDAKVAKNRKPDPRRRRTDDPDVQSRVARRLKWNWVFAIGVATLTTLTLSATLVFVRWGSGLVGELVLLIGLCVAVLGLVGHLTREQRRSIGMRGEIDRIEQSALKHRYSRVFELFNMSRVVGGDASPRSVFDGITKMCLEIFDCQRATLMLIRKDSAHVEVMAASGYTDKKMVGARQKIGEGIAGWVAKNHEPILLAEPGDEKKYQGLVYKKGAVSAAMVVPIIVDNKIIGVLNVSTRSPNVYYDKEDLKTLEAFAANIGVWILHIKKSEKMKKTIQEMHAALQSKLTQQPSS